MRKAFRKLGALVAITTVISLALPYASPAKVYSAPLDAEDYAVTLGEGDDGSEDIESNSSGYHIENPESYLSTYKAVERMYNPNTGEHFYTSTPEEQRVLKATGWRDEGVGWYAPLSGEPVYRLYNPNSGDHHYTMSKNEKDTLSAIGWNYEGIGWYSNVYKTVPLYRQYNPNADIGSHNYTTSQNESYRLVYSGWKYEGIAWYGIDINSGYSNSSLISYVNISPNKSVNRKYKIDTITIHHMSVNLSVEKCGEMFAKESRRASSNYGISSDGRIGLYVEEKDRAWTSSNGENDNRAITIEVANDGFEKDHWHISDAAMDSLIKLCADICRRNGIAELKWEADPSLIGQTDRQNLTVHKWFANTDCPGPYIFFSLPKIANETNKLLGKETHISPYIYKGIDYSPVYNPEFYLDNNEDLKIEYGNDMVTPMEHFVLCGMKEKRQASPNFNLRVYMDNNPDLVKAFGDDYPAYYKHYCVRGRFEDRVSH